MTDAILTDTLMQWALLDDDIILAFEPEPQDWWRHADELPDGLGDEVDDGQAEALREEDDPRQTCLPWRRPAEKPAWLVQLCQRGLRQAEPVATTDLPANGLAQVEAVFRGLGRLLKP